MTSPAQATNDVASTDMRLAGLDGLKGLAILGVVLIHAAPVDPSIYQRHVVNGTARLAVPVFLVITGFLAGVKQTSKDKLRLYLVRFLRLHVIYGGFYWLVEVARAKPLAPVTLKSAVLHFGEAAWPGQFYFVILIQIFFVGAFWLAPGRWRSPLAVGLAGLTALVGFAVLPLARDPAGAGLAWHALRRIGGSGSAVWLWLYYFALGALLGDLRRSGRLPRTLRDPRGGAALLGLAVAVATAAWPVWGDPLVDPYARLCILVGTTAAALAIPSLVDCNPPRVLRRLGAESFGVFVFNPALLFALYAVVGPAREPWISWLYVAVVAALAVPITAFLRRWAPALVP